MRRITEKSIKLNISSIEPPARQPEKTVSQPGWELKLMLKEAQTFIIKIQLFNRENKFQGRAETSFFLDFFASFLIQAKKKRK